MHHEFLLGFFSSGLQLLFFDGLLKAGLIRIAYLKMNFFRRISKKLLKDLSPITKITQRGG